MLGETNLIGEIYPNRKAGYSFLKTLTFWDWVFEIHTTSISK